MRKVVAVPMFQGRARAMPLALHELTGSPVGDAVALPLQYEVRLSDRHEQALARGARLAMVIRSDDIVYLAGLPANEDYMQRRFEEHFERWYRLDIVEGEE